MNFKKSLCVFFYQGSISFNLSNDLLNTRILVLSLAFAADLGRLSSLSEDSLVLTNFRLPMVSLTVLLLDCY